MRTPPLVVLVAVLGLGLSACATTPPTAAQSPSGSVSPSAPESSPTPSPAATASTPSQTPSATAAPSTPTAPEPIELRGDGLGAYTFGAKEVDVTTLLEARFGPASDSHQGIRCELDRSSPWVRTVSWGDFWVEYAAKTTSKKAPRTLAGWGVAAGTDLKSGLTVQDGVSPALTFSQLKTAYPKGKLQDLGLGDGSKRFIVPNRIFFVGDGNKPHFMQAGAFTVCE